VWRGGRRALNNGQLLLRDLGSRSLQVGAEGYYRYYIPIYLYLLQSECTAVVVIKWLVYIVSCTEHVSADSEADSELLRKESGLQCGSE
jgi:hypothetical protein